MGGGIGDGGGVDALQVPYLDTCDTLASCMGI